MKSLILFAILIPALLVLGEEEDDDFIVIEAARRSQVRQGRQILIRQDLAGATPGAVPVVPLVFTPPNQPCITSDQRPGQCKRYSECYPYFRIFELNSDEEWVMGSYDTCGFTGPQGKHVVGVCCAPKEVPGSDVIDNEEEEEEEGQFGDFPLDPLVNEQCGYRHAFDNDVRIINGQVASVNEFPFMVAMLNKRRQFCGGSIVDEKHILTASHCVAHMSKYDVQNLKIVVGDHNLKQSGETRGEVKQYSVKRVIRHKKFDRIKLYNDVAILTLDKPIKMSNTIQPICLATDDNQRYTNELVQVAGWGTTTPGGGSSSDVLRKVDVKVWTNGECSSSYGNDAPGGIKKSMICASLRGNPVRDSCSGDSGGALFKCSGTKGPCTQVGIVSWGIGCAQAKYPGVYTRVSSYIKWIKKIVRKY